MIHLRSFNENINISDLQNLCDDSLAYLKDDGYQIEIKEQTINNDISNKYNKTKNKRTGREQIIRITISKADYRRVGNSSKGTLFEWNNIKDDLIPFLELLRDNDNYKWYVISGYEVLFISPGPYFGGSSTGLKTLSDVKNLGIVNFMSNSTLTYCSIDDIIDEKESISKIINNTDVLLAVDVIIRLNYQLDMFK
jgi:hypothetical protein